LIADGTRFVVLQTKKGRVLVKGPKPEVAAGRGRIDRSFGS
jgi:hypothetical protein